MEPLPKLSSEVVATVLYPFINPLVASIGITHGDDKKIGYYAGVIESVFFLAQFMVVFFWGRLSDQLGRKPVVLFSLIAIAFSTCCFGLSQRYISLILSRAVAGIFGGTGAVIRSAIAEVTDDENVAEAFALVPIFRAVGNTLGPLIGGILSRPHERFPLMFAAKFWKDYPYFLPCVCAAFICLISAALVGFLSVETLPHQNRARNGPEREPLLPTSSTASPLPCEASKDLHSTPTSTFTRPVVVVVANYGFLSLLEVSYSALLPLFYSTPVVAGGLGLSPPQIGVILGITGVVQGILLASLSARSQRRFGPRIVYVFGIGYYLVIWSLFPVMNALAHAQTRRHSLSHQTSSALSPLICTLITLQTLLSIASNVNFGCIFVILSAVSPRLALGSSNGFAQTVASFVRMLGPAGATSLFALTMEHDILRGTLVYLVLAAITLPALAMAMALPVVTLSQ